MHTLVYLGPGRRALQSKPRPVSRDPADEVVRITTSTISDGKMSVETARRRAWRGTVRCADRGESKTVAGKSGMDVGEASHGDGDEGGTVGLTLGLNEKGAERGESVRRCVESKAN